jgi:hypothetical protein
VNATVQDGSMTVTARRNISRINICYPSFKIKETLPVSTGLCVRGEILVSFFG